ncbi:SusC/RagA family TonB-linked outer membrane protein [Chitinophaga defluvii]|uniref:TonB-dependent receptor n=1 Tax=Chitinophaga defluvii TaxID=3163343 RepID=A0ABV2TCD5_9BACT
MKKYLFRLLAFMPLLVFFPFSGGYVMAQDASRTIRGKVVDAETGQPVIGATVRIQHKNTGTATSQEGLFSIEAVSSDVLQFTSIGYEVVTIPVKEQNFIAVKLGISKSTLNDVVVVGYGTQKKINMTGAVSTVNSKVIEDRPITTLAGALQGAAAGLVITRTSGQPGAENFGIQIRGATSANGAVSPLVILDGVAASTTVLLTLNPNDVENVTMLKDAAAASIYGAQAAGGVMIVTTKKGKSGKAVFEYSNLFSAQKPLNVPEKLSLLEEMLYVNVSAANSGGNPGYSATDINRVRLGLQYYVDPNDTTRYVNYNSKSQLAEILRNNSAMSTHNFSVKGGTEKTHYLLSLGLFDQNGIFKIGPDKYKRYNARINMGTQITDKITFDARVGFHVTDMVQPTITPDGTWSTSLLNVLYRFRNRNPLRTPEGRYNDNSAAGITSYAILDAGGQIKSMSRNLDGVFTLQSKDLLVKGLDLTIKYGGQYYNNENANFYRTVQTWFRSVPGEKLQDPNSFERSVSTNWNSNVQFLADYDWSFGKDHSFHLLGGYQWNDNRYQYLGASVGSLVSNDLGALALGNNLTRGNWDNVGTSAFQSVFGRFNYVFRDKYLVEATLRADESSRLSPGRRTKVFPAVSAGWKLQNEPWFEVIRPVFSEFKIRGSWGRLGSAEGGIIGEYDYIDKLWSGSNVVLGNTETKSSYFYNGAIPSATLTWETLETSNLGVDLGLLKNKLNISFDYYVKHNNNMLIPQQLPVILGINAPVVNGGKLRSWGWEIQLSYADRTAIGIDYSVSFNLSDNQNKLLKYNNNNSVWLGTVSLLEGYPLNTIWGYKTDGYIQNQKDLDNSPFYSSQIGIGDVKYVDQDRNGMLNNGSGIVTKRGDLVYLGTNQPRYSFGWTGSVAWKGIDLQLFLQGVFQNTFLAETDAIHPSTGSWIIPLKMHLDYWTEDNRDAAFPRPRGGTASYLTSDKWMMNGAYMRLKNIQLGYSLPKQLLEKIHVNRLRLFFSGQDILTWDKLGIFSNTFNPESMNSVGHNYPLFGTYSFGVNVSF